MKLHSLRDNPFKPSVVKEHGYWWAKAKNMSGGMAISVHPNQAEAFKAATRLAGADQ